MLGSRRRPLVGRLVRLVALSAGTLSACSNGAAAPGDGGAPSDGSADQGASDGAHDEAEASASCLGPLEGCTDPAQCCSAMSCDRVGDKVDTTCCIGVNDPCVAAPGACCADMLCVGDGGIQTCRACGYAGHPCAGPLDCCPGFQCNAQGTCEAG